MSVLAAACFGFILAAAPRAADLPEVVFLPEKAPGLVFAAGEIQRLAPAARVELGEPRRSDLRAVVAKRSAPPEGEEQGFIIERRGEQVWVLGEGRGLIYGLLEVADQLLLRGLGGVRAGRYLPYVKMRGIKFNMPLAGGGYIGADKVARGAWFFDMDFWNKFLAMMARNRYNLLTLWSAHPFHHLVRVEKFPEATDLSPAQLERNIAAFRAMLRRAKELGIDVYVITWNIHVSPSFAKAHNIPASGKDTPLVREYIRECVRALVDTYPDLAGIGTCPGERMPMAPAEKLAWIAETYFAGMRRAQRQLPFILRYWQSEPQATAQMLDRERWPAPIYLSVKYNGEHMYSSPRFHLKDHRWLTLAEGRYNVLWHLRNDCIFTFRWGDPQFARETAKNTRAPYSCGYFMGSESLVPGTDFSHIESARNHVTWNYEFEKNWFLYALWGRMGYDPNTPEELFRAQFRQRFGQAGDPAYQALVAASRIIPRTTSFHWNYMNGDWRPEENRGSWNTSYELPIRSFRDKKSFHSVLEFIFNLTIDDSMVCIPDYVALTVAGKRPTKPGQLSPYDVADALEADARRARAAIAEAMARAPQPPPELVCTRADVLALAALGDYYAEKIRAATELCFFLIQGDARRREKAVAHLEKAKQFWDELVARAAEHYPTMRWEQVRRDVEKDIALAREAQPLPSDQDVWEVAAASRPIARWPRINPASWTPLVRKALRCEGAPLLIPWCRRMNELVAGALVRPKAVFGARPAAAYYARQQFREQRSGAVQFIVSATAPFRLAVDGREVLSAPRAARGAWATLRLGAGEHTMCLELRGDDPAFALARAPLPVAQPAFLSQAVRADEIVAPMVVRAVDGAVGGRAVVVPRGAGRGDDAQGNPIDHGWLAFTFSLPEPGEYRIYARCYWPGPTANSFFLELDDAPAEVFGNDLMYGRWHWVPSRKRFQLAAGKHTLRLRTRETDTRVDQVLVAREG